MNLGRISAWFVALLMMAPLFGAGEGPVEVVQHVEATEQLTSWSTQTGWWLPNSHYPRQAIYHDGRALVFVPDPHSVWRTYVYDHAPPGLPAAVGEVQFHHSLRQSFLPVSHAGDLYAFGSDSSNGGEVYLLDPATWEQTVVAEGAAVGEYAAGVSTGDEVYIFPGSTAALDPAQIWRFDPLSGSLTGTGVTVPFSGPSNDARHATALWTGSEVVLVGGNNQQGRVFTWTPGDDRMKVLPFDFDGTQDSLDGHAIWTGASIYILGEPRARDIIRITLDPPSFEKLPIRLVDDGNGGDIVWDGSDAYIFTSRNGIIRFHPWESDLPRVRMGEDVDILLDFNFEDERNPSGFRLCFEEFSPFVQVSQAVWDHLWGTVDKYIDYDDGFCIPNLGSLDLFTSYTENGDVARLQAQGTSASFPLLAPITGSAAAFDEVVSAIQAVLTLISLHPWQAPGSATVGHMYFVERQCAEQDSSIQAEMILNYQYWGFLAATAAGGAGSFASVDIVGQPYTKGLGFGREAANPIFHDDLVARHWEDKEVTLQAGGSEQETMQVHEGLGTSYVSLTGTGWAATHILGAAAYNVDFENSHKRLELHNIQFDFHDETVPEVTFEDQGLSGRDGWFVGPVRTNVEGQDPESCVNLLSVSDDEGVIDQVEDTWGPRLTIERAEDGVHSLTTEASNLQFERASDIPHEVKIDSTSPSSTHSLSGIGQNGWYRSCVDLTILTTDATSGSAERFSDRAGDGEVEAASREFCAEGVEPFTYWAWDVAGNVEEANEGPVLKIDRTPPHGGVGPYDGLEGHEDWYQSCVVVPVLGWDALSGFDFAEYAINDGAFIEGDEAEVCDEGFNAIHVIAHDVAGNEDVQRSFEVKVDDTDPRVATSVPSLTVLGDPAQVSYDADDELSGLYGTIGVEMRYEPLVGEPTSFQRVCTDESYQFTHSGSCEVSLEELGRYCFRTWVGDRARNVGVSEVDCTTYFGL